MPTAVLTFIALSAIGWYGWHVGQRRADAFAPARAFPALYLVWFALGSMNLIPPDPATPVWDPIPPDLWIYIGIGLASYSLGTVVLPPTRADWISPDRWRWAVNRWDNRVVKLTGVTLLAVIAWSFASLARQGALALLSTDPGTARVSWQGGFVVWSVYHSAILAYVPLALLYTWSHHEVSRTMRRVVYVTVAAILAATTLFANRGLVLEPALLAFLTLHYARRRVSLRALTIISTLGVLFLSLGGMYRDARQYGPAHIGTVVGWGFPLWSLPVTYIYGYVRDPVLTFHRLRAVVPDFEGYGLGRLHLAPLLAPLPGHQESPDLTFKRLLRSDFVGFGEPATLLGHLYVDGGMVAIILGMFLLGLTTQFVYGRMHRGPTPHRVLLHIWVVHVALWSLFTSLLPAITTVFVPFLLAALVSVVSVGSRLAGSRVTTAGNWFKEPGST